MNIQVPLRQSHSFLEIKIFTFCPFQRETASIAVTSKPSKSLPRAEHRRACCHSGSIRYQGCCSAHLGGLISPDKMCQNAICSGLVGGNSTAPHLLVCVRCRLAQVKHRKGYFTAVGADKSTGAVRRWPWRNILLTALVRVSEDVPFILNVFCRKTSSPPPIYNIYVD